jgi:hypothetical protein
LIGLFSLMLPWLLIPCEVHSQQYEATYVSASSENPELATARGGAIEGLFDLGRGWHMFLGFQRIWDNTEKETRVCAAYAPFISCQIEATRNELQLNGFRAGVVRPFLTTLHLELKAGVGLSFNQPRVKKSRGLVSGRRADIYMPTGGQVGGLGLLTLDLTPAPQLGLAFTVGVVGHWVKFDGCSDIHYDPFCDPTTFREIHVGLAYSPPR